MRVIVYGIGAIGGAIAARLALAGTSVIGIARGGMLDEIYAQGGLNLVTSEQSTLVPMSVVAHPDDITWQKDDVVLLTMKSNDTEAALRALVGAGVQSQTIICAQNGVANEVMALRQFPNVVAMVMMMPAQYLKAGKVIAPGAPKTGLFDLGNFPSGIDKVPTELVEALHTAGFDCDVRKDAMAGKYGKLLMNLGNIVEAALGKDARQGDWNKRARKEGEQVLKAAGIEYYTVEKDNPRRALMNVAEVPGYTRVGSSSTQSLLRGTGEIETDYLNGEIVMLGRIHGVRTPVNAAFVRVARQMVQNGTAPGAFSEDEVQRLVTACEAVS